MNRLLVFNCSNDMALACGVGEYVPPKQIRAMENEMAFVPKIIADVDDVVVSMEELDRRDGYKMLSTSPQPFPWGWSLAIKNKFRRFGVPESKLPSDEKLELLRQISSREFAVDYSLRLFSDMPLSIKSSCVENSMRTISSREEFEIMQRDLGTDIILKSFWSSSGRGNRIVYREKTENLNTVKFPCIADVFCDKVLDFAMEFEVKDSDVEYLGLSVFEASREGRYEKNYVESQDLLAKKIGDALEEESCDFLMKLQLLREAHISMLQQSVVGKYSGPIGIDMMIVKGTDGARLFHPCVELNFRMNMGILALLVYEKYGSKVKSISLETLKTLV